jgi:hypothetical protein
MLQRLGEFRDRRLRSGGGDLAIVIGVGGVLGAAMHYPDLDLTGAPQLDLCLFGGDDDFLRELDAGLLPSVGTDRKPVLVIHCTWDMRRERPGDTNSGSRSPLYEAHPDAPSGAASMVDYFTDLLEMGYQAEARDFAVAMTRRAE